MEKEITHKDLRKSYRSYAKKNIQLAGGGVRKSKKVGNILF